MPIGPVAPVAPVALQHAGQILRGNPCLAKGRAKRSCGQIAVPVDGHDNQPWLLAAAQLVVATADVGEPVPRALKGADQLPASDSGETGSGRGDLKFNDPGLGSVGQGCR